MTFFQRSTRPSGRQLPKIAWTGLVTGLGISAAAAADLPRLDVPGSSAAIVAPAVATDSGSPPVVQVRVRGGGGGGGYHGGGGGGYRGGGGGYRGGGGRGPYYRGGFYGGPLVIGPAYGYSYYSGDDCRAVRVSERRCWVDDDGDRTCGVRWVVRRICD